MKFTTFTAVIILAFTSSAAAQHVHHPARQAKEQRRDEILKRDQVVETVVETQFITVDQDGIPWATSVDYGNPIQESESPPTTSSTEPAPTTTAAIQASSSSNTPTPETAKTSSSLAAATSAVSGNMYVTTGTDTVFPDGVINCTVFPSAYGAMDIEYLGLGGWTGIQLNDADVSTCQEGALCSYACAPGYSKSQWPADQPPDGQSRGGLLCEGGLLKLTRPSVPTLCVAGQGSANLVNKMSKSVAVCRTDYPGTENMVIPVYPSPGTTEPLTVVIEDEYYVWEGGKTSAQYYVNKAGISDEDGCLWGTEELGVGNFAPLVFGAGYSEGKTWISIFANPLANGAQAGYNVKIIGDTGASVNGECVYANGAFQTPDGKGCTVTVISGTGLFVFEDDS